MPLFLFILMLFFAPTGSQSTSPNLHGQMNYLAVNEVPGGIPNVVVIASIANSGLMPSFASSWRFTINHANQNINCPLATVPEKFDINIPARGGFPQRSVTYYGKDSLASKALNPIPAGGVTTGILYCELKNIDAKILRMEDEYTVYFMDVLSKQYSMTVKGNGTYTDLMYFPGITQDIK
jgi:hypothetical protein